MKTRSTTCPDHPDFLERMATAEGERAPLPAAPNGCALCEGNLERYSRARVLLRREADGASILSSEWQAGVWLALGQSGHEQQAGGRRWSPTLVGDEPDGAGELGGAVKVVPFPSSQPSGPGAGEGGGEAPGARPPAPGRRKLDVMLYSGAVAAVVLVALAVTVGSHEPPEPPPRTLWRGADMMVQPANPPAPDAPPPNLEGRVALKAYAMDLADEEKPVDTLKNGSSISTTAQLSFDYATVSPEVDDGELRYLTVVAVVESQDAQQRAVPEGKQLLWLVESRPIEDTRGELSVLEEEDIRIDAPPGEMTIFGLFSSRPVPARAIEDALLLHQMGPNALPGVNVARLELKVEGE